MFYVYKDGGVISWQRTFLLPSGSWGPKTLARTFSTKEAAQAVADSVGGKVLS
jgi:nitrous oxide reductase accessory protein NosL